MLWNRTGGRPGEVDEVATYALARTRGRGFTLIEVLIVITVITLLSLIVIPRAMSARRRAKEAQLKGNLKQLRDAVERFEATTGAWPPTLADVMASNPTAISGDFDGRGGWVDRTAYDGPYLLTGNGQLPRDPFTTASDWNYEGATGAVHSSSDLSALDGSAYNTW
jgi:prepilin-type N-terminal cleavage/methylation domain-containing protein